MGLLWQEGIKPLDIHRRLSTVCGARAPARNTAFSWVRSLSSGTVPVQAGGRPRYRNTRKDCSREATRKLPRKWQRSMTGERNTLAVI
jgi:hypothetical protein